MRRFLVRTVYNASFVVPRGWLSQLANDDADASVDLADAGSAMLRNAHGCASFRSSDTRAVRVDMFRAFLGPAELRAGPFFCPDN